MSEKKFSKKHEWVSVEGDIATVGITKHATELLGDIVFVEVPEAGTAATGRATKTGRPLSPAPREPTLCLVRMRTWPSFSNNSIA